MLTGKRKTFVEAILEGQTAHDATVNAGYSEKSAYQAASRLLKEPEIADAIRHAVKAKEQTLEQLEGARQLAMDTKDAGSAVKAIELEAHIQGVLKSVNEV